MINFVSLACLDKGALDFDCVQYLSENLDLTSPVLSAKELVKEFLNKERKPSEDN